MKTTHFALSLLLALCTAPMIGCGGDDNNNNANVPGNNPGEKPGENPGEKPGENSGEFTINLVKSDKIRADSKISNADLKSFIKGQYDLNYDILRKSGDEIAKNNAMISIYSIQTALAMTWAGAAGDTATEMKNVLKFGDHAHEALNKLDKMIMALNKDAKDNPEWGMHIDPIEIKTSNNLYLSPKYTWATDWLDALAVNYGAGITEMNFAADTEKARQYINNVVSEDTHERIQDLIPADSITINTQLVITNAIFFKAPWGEEVFKANKLDFTKADGGKVSVDALNNLTKLSYVKGKDYQAVVEPLRDDAFEIMFILPDEGKFDAVMNSLNGEKILGIFDALQNKDVKLTFPMYTFTTELGLSETLQSMGMTKAFGAADFSKMTVEPNSLFISDVRHKSFIAVDENGIEAAAATMVAEDDEGAPEIPEDLIILTLDRPFMFIVYETQTRTPLFVGHVMDPSVGK